MKYKIISLVLLSVFTLQSSSVLTTVGLNNGKGYSFFSEYANSLQHRSFAFDAQNNIVVVLGALFRGTIVRYNSTGTFDTTFNQMGYLRDESDQTGQYSTVYNDIGIAQNSDILVVGSTLGFTPVIACYTNAGILKTSFNSTGYVVNIDGNSYQGMVIDASNRIIAVGQAQSKGLIACYTMAGQVDTSFGANGYTIEDPQGENSIYNKVILDTFGRIIVVGAKSDLGGQASKGFIACYSNNGQIDTTFNGGGTIHYLTANFVPNAQNYNQLILDKKGKIVVVGRTDQARGIIARYTINGTLDTTFNGVGYVILPEEATDCYGLVIDSRNYIIVSGPVNNGGFMACYTEDGMLDTTWNNSGYFNPKINSLGATYHKLRIDNNGKIVAVGETANSNGAITARYFSNGILDSGSSWDSSNFRIISNFNNIPIGILSH